MFQIINDKDNFCPNYTLNILNLRCPESLMMIRKAIRSIKSGETLLIITNDLTTVRDISNFCIFMKHELIVKQTECLPYKYLLRKG